MPALVLALASCANKVNDSAGRVNPSPNPPTTSWGTLPSMPTPRMDAAGASVSGLFFVAGGLAEGKVTNTVEYFDPQAKAWRPSPPLPLPVHGAMAVSYLSDLVVIGGFTDVAGTTPSARAFIYKAGKWAPFPSLHHARGFGAAAIAVGKIVVAGGAGASGAVAATEVFSGGTWHDANAMPGARAHVGSATDGGYLYVAGGSLGGKASNLLQRYDPVKDRWTSLARMSIARVDLGLAATSNQVVAFGGVSGDGTVPGETDIFNIIANKWSNLKVDMPTPRHSIAYAVVSQIVYAAGGSAHAGPSFGSALEALELASLQTLL